MSPFPIPSICPFRIMFDGPPRRVETKEAKYGIDSVFYESVVLLDDIKGEQGNQ
jgi:hypothetical protein